LDILQPRVNTAGTSFPPCLKSCIGIE